MGQRKLAHFAFPQARYHALHDSPAAAGLESAPNSIA
jgi:hypothetical protein